jgi:ElaB/YqjD/DUF883 family membrane-anchored ribosome-binding protein
MENTKKGGVMETTQDMHGEASKRFNKAKDDMQEAFHRAQEQAQEMRENSEDFIRQHPISTVLGACAVGFIAGALLKRIRH